MAHAIQPKQIHDLQPTGDSKGSPTQPLGVFTLGDMINPLCLTSSKFQKGQTRRQYSDGDSINFAGQVLEKISANFKRLQGYKSVEKKCIEEVIQAVKKDLDKNHPGLSVMDEIKTGDGLFRDELHHPHHSN